MSDPPEFVAGHAGAPVDPSSYHAELNARLRRAVLIESAARWVVECPRAQRDEEGDREAEGGGGRKRRDDDRRDSEAAFGSWTRRRRRDRGRCGRNPTHPPSAKGASGRVLAIHRDGLMIPDFLITAFFLPAPPLPILAARVEELQARVQPKEALRGGDRGLTILPHEMGLYELGLNELAKVRTRKPTAFNREADAITTAVRAELGGGRLATRSDHAASGRGQAGAGRGG